MKHELAHFQIEDSYGGNQDWFPTLMMRMGGFVLYHPDGAVET